MIESPAELLAREARILGVERRARAPLLLALGPLAEVSSPRVRLGVARVYATLPLHPNHPIGAATIAAVNDLVALFDPRAMAAGSR